MKMQFHKAVVKVLVVVAADRTKTPVSLTFEDGKEYPIDRVCGRRRAAATKWWNRYPLYDHDWRKANLSLRGRRSVVCRSQKPPYIGDMQLKYLSRNDLETISGRVIAAYKRLPAISDQALERVDIDFLCQELLGLRIDYARLSLNGEKIGLTSSCDIGVEVFPEDPNSTEEQYYMLDGKTILIESELMKEGANIGRRNYTVSHESCHHILKMLFPHDYGAQAKARSVHCYYRSSRGNTDWEEWQVETLAAMILLPPECVIRSMERFGLGTQMRLLNRVFASADYKKFEAMASFMGASKTALSIRMIQLGLLKRNDLSDPYRLVRVEMDEEDRML